MMEDVAYLQYVADINRLLYISVSTITSNTNNKSNDLTVSVQIITSMPPSHKGDPVLLQEVRMQTKRKSLELKNT